MEKRDNNESKIEKQEKDKRLFFTPLCISDTHCKYLQLKLILYSYCIERKPDYL